MNARILLTILTAAAATAAPAQAQTQTGPCGLFEAVEPGDTLDTVAARCGVTVELLRRANPGVAEPAPQVATVLALTLPDSSVVVAEPVDEGPKVVEAPADDAVVVLSDPGPDAAATPADAAAAEMYLTGLTGLWVRAGQACADPEFQWWLTAEDITVGQDRCVVEGLSAARGGVRLETLCGEHSVVIGRDFVLAPLGPDMVAFQTGEQDGRLERCE